MSEVLPSPNPKNARTVVARKGYSVGGIALRSGAALDGFCIRFMRDLGDRLDPKDSYFSPWIGGKGGDPRAPFTSPGQPVIGVWGSYGGDIHSLGLILASPKKGAKASAGRVYLDDLVEVSSQVAWGYLGRHGESGYGDRTLQGKRLAHCLSAHPPSNSSSQITYRLGRAYRTFNAAAAIWDEDANAATGLIFRVYGDGKLLGQSRPIRRTGDAQRIQVTITGVDELRLDIFCPGSNGSAHALWAEPHVLR